jgi:hypothetical protein
MLVSRSIVGQAVRLVIGASNIPDWYRSTASSHCSARFSGRDVAKALQ